MKLFVGALSYEVTEDELRDLFEDCGEVTSVKIIADRDTGRSKGFGFVEMASNAEGEQAIKTLNGKDLKGRTIAVNESRPREDKPRRGFGGGGGNRRGKY